MNGADYFISDLHLAPDTPVLNHLFATFLERDAAGSRSLTIVGDFFEAWFGYKQYRLPFYRELVGRLTELSKRGTLVRFVAGNRDFLFARDARRAEIDGFKDHTLVMTAKERVAAIHGDTFCLDDHAYLRFRRVVRAVPWHWVNHVATPGFGQGVSNYFRTKSKARRVKYAHLPRTYYDIKDSAVLAFLDRTGADTVVCGHIHEPQERVYQGKRERRILVMGDWRDDGAVIAQCGDGVPLKLVHLSEQGIRDWPHEVQARQV